MLILSHKISTVLRILKKLETFEIFMYLQINNYKEKKMLMLSHKISIVL